MLRIENYIMIGKDDMPDEMKEKKSFTIIIDENTFRIAHFDFGEEFCKDIFEEQIKKEIIKRIDEVLESSEYIEELKR